MPTGRTPTASTCQPGCEINLSGSPTQGALSPTFGLLSEATQFGGFDRPYSIESGFEVQHELLTRLSVTGSWYHTSFKNLTKTVNLNRRSIAEDYVPLTIYNPIDGTPITYYNSTAAYQARPTNNVAVNEPLRSITYNSFASGFTWRPRAGTQVFGGFAWERSIEVNCGTSIPNAFVDPNEERFCDENDSGKPYSVDFRLGVSYPLPFGITFGASFMNNDEGSKDADYSFSRTIRYPDGSRNYLIANQPAPPCPAPCTPGAITAPTYVGALAGTTQLYPDGTVDADRLDAARREVLEELQAESAQHHADLRGVQSVQREHGDHLRVAELRDRRRHLSTAEQHPPGPHHRRRRQGALVIQNC